MLMPWFHRSKNTGDSSQWEKTFVNVERTKWEDLKKGDVVFIPGNLVHDTPTTMFGKHTVVDPEKQLLKNKSGKIFYEYFPYVFKEVEK